MKCENCNCEYTGEVCPDCNGLPDTIRKQAPSKKTGKLLGFRTNRLWKKIVSILYLIFCFIYLLAVISTEKYVNITNHDFIISQICDSLIFVIMITPYIFLSNTKFRNILPLFKKHSIGASTIGLIIVTIIIGVISGIIDAAHSEAFLNDRENHAYTQTVTEATCEKAGEIKKQCEYCGISETETVAALGHKMTEISRKEATETTEGEIVEECSVCGKQKKTVLEKIPTQSSSLEENSSTTESSSKTETERNTSSDNSSKENSSTVSSSSEKLSSASQTYSKSSVENSTSSNSSSKDNSTTNNSTEATSSTSAAKQEKTPEEIKIEYMDSCDYIDYEWLLRRPDDYIGHKVCFEGIVCDVTEGVFSDYTTYLIMVNKDEFDNWTDILYVKYTLPKGDSKILENDLVQIYGECQGDYTYITTEWEDVTVPYIKAEYIDIVIP